MRKQKISLILLAVAIFGIMGATAVEAYEMADSFRNPLENYAITGYRFGEYEGNSKYHAGEDLRATPLTLVYPIAKGIIKQVQPDSSSYGSVLVMEHTLPDNSKIISIYGHLNKTSIAQLRIGTEIIDTTKPIAKIGYRYENGALKYAPHLHFGIKKGAYASLYEGIVYSSATLSNFYKPSDYLNLIRTVDTNDVYRLSNLGNKAYVSATSFTSCGWRSIDVRLVSSTEMSRHSTFYPQSVCFTPGTFIKRSNNPDISLIKGYSDGSGTVKNNFRQRFTNWDAFIRAGGKSDLSNVKIVSDAEYDLHAQGKDLTYNGNY